MLRVFHFYRHPTIHALRCWRTFAAPTAARAATSPLFSPILASAVSIAATTSMHHNSKSTNRSDGAEKATRSRTIMGANIKEIMAQAAVGMQNA